MYPYAIIGDIGLYEIFLALGVLAAFAVYRFTADKLKMSARLFNFTLICAVIAITVGIFSAVFVQALYNISERGAFIIDANTGATFAGGLIGGAATFLAIYFIFGKKADQEYLSQAALMADCAACSIPAAHALGRIGCLMAGCCYGHKTDSFIGIYMQNLGHKVVPTQLFEAIFLVALAAFNIVFLLKKQRFTMCIYLASYGVWRFFIEFIRDDYRGTSFLPFLTPSQIISILMIIGSAVLFLLEKHVYNKKAAQNA